MLKSFRRNLSSYSPMRKKHTKKKKPTKKKPTKKKPPTVKKYTRKKPARVIKRKGSTSKKAKSKKTKNAYMTVLSKARKENAPSFVYNNKTYKRHETDKGFVYYK